MELEIILLSKVSLTQKDKYHVFFLLQKKYRFNIVHACMYVQDMKVKGAMRTEEEL